MRHMDKFYHLMHDIVERDVLVVVEGKKDARALREFGARRILELDTVYTTVESIDEKEVVLLVDLDKEGRKMYARLNDELSRRGVTVNNRLRHYLFKETKIRQIEGLRRYFGKDYSW